jgi:hypothetical protein
MFTTAFFVFIPLISIAFLTKVSSKSIFVLIISSMVYFYNKIYTIGYYLSTVFCEEFAKCPITGPMRQKRKLARGVWHEALSGINNREPLLRKPWAMALFFRVFEERAYPGGPVLVEDPGGGTA